MPQAYIRLRGAIFAEKGYCLDAPAGITRDSCAFFSTLNRKGKTVHLEQIQGTKGDSGAKGIEVLNVPLEPYCEPELGRAAVFLMCENLRGALDGDSEAQKSLGAVWLVVTLGSVCGFEVSSASKRMALLGAYYGEGRVFDELNRRGHLGDLSKLPITSMVTEALGV